MAKDWPRSWLAAPGWLHSRRRAGFHGTAASGVAAAGLETRRNKLVATRSDSCPIPVAAAAHAVVVADRPD